MRVNTMPGVAGLNRGHLYNAADATREAQEMLNSANRNAGASEVFDDLSKHIKKPLRNSDINSGPDSRTTDRLSAAEPNKQQSSGHDKSPESNLTRLLGMESPPERSNARSGMTVTVGPLAGLSKSQWLELRNNMTPEWVDKFKQHLRKELNLDRDKHQIAFTEEELDKLQKSIAGRKKQLDIEWNNLFGTSRDTALNNSPTLSTDTLPFLRRLGSECNDGEAKARLTELINAYEGFVDAAKPH
ncbi:hypothetical protein ABZV91_15540 [Nocardia sp. NPDC004568]|uniref:hypothetical protein n=1 Tax=Nocardia sp. NPDC004568 TaxID=3154551 RepID=UPI0033BBBC8A